MRRTPILLALAALAAPLTMPAAQPARILIITGQSDYPYHDWRSTTPFLEKLLVDTGRFEVRVIEEPRGITRDALAQFDAVLLNYNGPRWGAQAEAALEEFVRSGKGMVSLHGVTYGPLMGTTLRPGGGWNLVPAWTAYSEMLGVTWAPEAIGHAVRHAFTVKLTGDDPITRGMDSSFTVNDELYHRLTQRPGNHVNATAFDDAARGGTGKDEPIAWTVSYGQGRTFHTTLGHDTNALYEPSVMALLARATEWAATGQVTLPPHFDANDKLKDAVRVLVTTPTTRRSITCSPLRRASAGRTPSHSARPSGATCATGSTWWRSTTCTTRSARRSRRTCAISWKPERAWLPCTTPSSITQTGPGGGRK
jgi:hypothetical protein